MEPLWNQSGKEKQDVKEFWENLEAKLGEKILARSLGEYLSGYNDWNASLWGLFYLTSSTLYFQHFRQMNWLSALMSSAGSGGGDEDRMFAIPLEDTEQLVQEKTGSLLSRIITSAKPLTILTYRDETRIRRELRFRLEQDVDHFIKVLELEIE